MGDKQPELGKLRILTGKNAMITSKTCNLE